MDEEEKYLTPKETSKLLRVTVRCLELWENQGQISCIRTKGGHRRFPLSEVLAKAPGGKKLQEKFLEKSKENVCYCRVSTHSQKEDLERQAEFFRLRYPNYTIIKDMGSGLNFKRKGLNSILDKAIRGRLGEVVVTHKDRLCRFGFEFFERIISKCSNGKIVVLDKTETSPEKELVNDLLSIVTVFSSRLYGLRSHSLRQRIREEANKNTEITTVSESKGKNGVAEDV